MSAAYGDRFEFVVGLSNNTVRAYAQKHPDLQCDVLFIDGAKFPDQRFVDLHTFRKLARSQAVLFYDEAASLPCVRGQVPEKSSLCSSPDGASKAYNRAAKQGLTKVIDCRWAVRGKAGYPKEGKSGGDGSCVAEYV